MDPEIIYNEADDIIEKMITKMGYGGMDISYSGHLYNEAKSTAIKEILELRNDVLVELRKKIWEKTRPDLPYEANENETYNGAIKEFTALISKQIIEL